MDTVDRDQTPAKNSMTQFKRLIDQYPESEFAQKAKEKSKKVWKTFQGMNCMWPISITKQKNINLH